MILSFQEQKRAPDHTTGIAFGAADLTCPDSFGESRSSLGGCDRVRWPRRCASVRRCGSVGEAAPIASGARRATAVAQGDRHGVFGMVTSTDITFRAASQVNGGDPGDLACNHNGCVCDALRVNAGRLSAPRMSGARSTTLRPPKAP